MMRINKEAVAVLADTLENGAYTQAHDALRKGDSFCCLGVACDLVPQLGKWHETGSFETTDGDSTELDLPYLVQEYYGFEDENPWVSITGEEADKLELSLNYKLYEYSDGTKRTTLATLNDKGFSFKEIATIIRRNFLQQ